MTHWMTFTLLLLLCVAGRAIARRTNRPAVEGTCLVQDKDNVELMQKHVKVESVIDPATERKAEVALPHEAHMVGWWEEFLHSDLLHGVELMQKHVKVESVIDPATEKKSRNVALPHDAHMVGWWEEFLHSDLLHGVGSFPPLHLSPPAEIQILSGITPRQIWVSCGIEKLYLLVSVGMFVVCIWLSGPTKTFMEQIVVVMLQFFVLILPVLLAIYIKQHPQRLSEMTTSLFCLSGLILWAISAVGIMQVGTLQYIFGQCWKLSHDEQGKKMTEKEPGSLGKEERTQRLYIVFSAYLPNERSTLPESLSKVFQALKAFPSAYGATVIVAYNTGAEGIQPEDSQALHEMNTIAMAKLGGLKYHCLHVQHSRSKAENMNAAVAFVKERESQPELAHFDDVIIGFFDADHWISDQGILCACHILHDQTEVGVVVGRSRSRSPESAFLNVETDLRYTFDHLMFHRFGGSGFWRLSLLDQMEPFSDKLLLEDVEASILANLKGAQVRFSPDIEILEEVPPSYAALWKQRVRWHQGSLELSFRYASEIFCSSSISLSQKLFIYHSTIFSPLLQPFTRALGPLFVIYAATGLEASNMHHLLRTMTGALLVLMVSLNLLPPFILLFFRRHPLVPWWNYFWMPLGMIAWSNFVLAVQCQAIVNHVIGKIRWEVTARFRRSAEEILVCAPSGNFAWESERCKNKSWEAEIQAQKAVRT